MVGLVRVPLLNREGRLLGRVRPGPRSGFLLGVAFAFGWAPCIGPVLATILTAAAATETVIWGAILLTMYSLGLGVPFVFLALGMPQRRETGHEEQRGPQHHSAIGSLVNSVHGEASDERDVAGGATAGNTVN